MREVKLKMLGINIMYGRLMVQVKPFYKASYQANFFFFFFLHVLLIGT